MKTCPVCDSAYPGQHKTCPTDGAVLIESRELEPGQLVRGKYRILRKLGQGGMGTVYLAEHLLLGGELALKFLNTELSKNPQFVKRFRNEARAAYQLRHPNIVEVGDLDQDEDGGLFIAMEYVAGPNLRSVLREAKAPIPIPRTLQIASGIAAGLAAAHARGAVHRDIKPENILLQIESRGEVQPKILDFGIAAMTENITNLSRTHGLLLTPEYAAPEQWRGTPATELDGRTDLYALGGVLYEMLVGHTPFHAANPEGWMYQHLQSAPEPLSAVRPEMARDYPTLDAIVLRLLAKDRDQRFSSAAAVQEALLFREAAPATERHASPHVLQTGGEPRPQRAPAATAKATAAWLPVSASLGDATEQAPPRSAERNRIFTASAIGERGEEDHAHGRPLYRKLLVGVSAAAVLIGMPFLLFWHPTPITGAPVFEPTGAFPGPPQPVTIVDHTENAAIHFTLDGSLPDQNSPVYSTPLLSLPTGVEVRAIAIAPNHRPSPVTTAWFTWSALSSKATAGSFEPARNTRLAGERDRNISDQPGQSKPRPITERQPQNQPTTGAVVNPGRTSPSETTSSDVRSPYEQGLSQYNQRHYSEAKHYFDEACVGGIPDACDHIGLMYQGGLGMARDTILAASFFSKACDSGSTDACSHLTQPVNNAVGACNSGDSCFSLALKYDRGTEVPRNYAVAAGYLAKACDAGSRDGCLQLGAYYRAGVGLPKDASKALQFFQKACALGSEAACEDVRDFR